MYLQHKSISNTVRIAIFSVAAFLPLFSGVMLTFLIFL